MVSTDQKFSWVGGGLQIWLLNEIDQAEDELLSSRFFRCNRSENLN